MADRAAPWPRLWVMAMGGLAGLAALAILALGAIPWAMLKDRIAREISRSIGRPVTIGTVQRLDTWSFHPRIRLTGLRIPQPSWVKAPLDDLAVIGRVDVSFPVWPLLVRRIAFDRIEVQGATLQLYRTAQGRKNWTREDRDDKGEGASDASLRMLRVANSRLRYLDEKRDRSLDVAVESDGHGLRVAGTGLVSGNPVRITAHGDPVVESRAPGPWPFSVGIEGPAVGFAIDGTMPRPLDIGHLEGRARGHARDLRLLDAIIEAGLPGTQPVRLTARIRRDHPDWTIEALKGTIGRSDIAGHATIIKREGRTRVTGALWSDRFDFDDLSSNEGKRREAASKARTGPRILPASAIDLGHVLRTDGTLDLAVNHLLWPGKSPFRNMKGRLSLERGRLELSPLRVGLTHGMLSGAMVIDQTRPGQKDPDLHLRLVMQGARMLDFFPRAEIDGSLKGRFDIRGRGHTMREAIGGGSGIIAMVGRDGGIPARTAAFLGQDVARAITIGKDRRDDLRCLAARLDLRGGIARPAPVLVDTSLAQTRIRGRIDLHDERLALALKGAPKNNSPLRLPGEVIITGTIKAPDIHIPAKAKTVGGLLQMAATAIAGKQEPLAQDADCNVAEREALR